MVAFATVVDIEVDLSTSLKRTITPCFAESERSE